MSSIEARYPQGPLKQTATEIRAHAIDVSNWTLTPTSPGVTEVIDESDGSDVIGTVMPVNTPTVTNSIITLSPLKLLTAGKFYRVEVYFTGDNSDRLEFHIRVEGI